MPVAVDDNTVTVPADTTEIKTDNIVAKFNYGTETNTQIDVGVIAGSLSMGDNAVTLFVPKVSGRYNAWSKVLTVTREPYDMVPYPLSGTWEATIGSAAFEYQITYVFAEGTVTWTQISKSNGSIVSSWEGTYIYNHASGKATVKPTGYAFLPPEYEVTVHLDRNPQEIWEPIWEKIGDQWVHMEKKRTENV